MRRRSLLTISSLFLIVIVFACNLPGAEEATPDTVATWVAATLTAIVSPTSAAAPTPTPVEEATPTLLQFPSGTALPTATPQNPLVLETILCWTGPGAQFDVVSALKKGERVVLIGRATISGWWIVDNPIYHDPCWAQAAYLQIEPGYNTLNLPFYTPPPTPTLTPTDTRTPTNTPTATNTP
jgi:hypothetical protein